MNNNRRDFLRKTTLPVAGLCLTKSTAGSNGLGVDDESSLARSAVDGSPWKIALSHESVLRMIRDRSLDFLDFPAFAIDTWGVRYLDYPNLEPSPSTDPRELEKLRSRSEAVGSQWFMFSDESLRLDSNFLSTFGSEPADWRQRIEQAATLGAKYLRLKWTGSTDCAKTPCPRLVDSLGSLAEQSSQLGVTMVLDPQADDRAGRQWLANVIQVVAHPGCTLATILDRSLPSQQCAAAREWLPAAAVIIAKSKPIAGRDVELQCDYPRFFHQAAHVGFRGFVAIDCDCESESGHADGIRATATLLDQVRRSYGSINHSERVANSILLPAGSRT